MGWIEIAILMLVTVALLPFTAFALAKMDIFFTRLETGDIKFIDSGSSLHRIIYDTPGFELDKNNMFIPSTAKRSHPWFGLYWVGIPPFRKIHKFTIVKERENPSGTNVENWITKGKEEEVSSLRFTFPRPYAFPKVELGDKDPVAIDVLAVSKFEVVDPIKLVYKLKGKFFENAGGIINAAVGDRLNDFTLKDFIDEDKGEVNGILSHLKDPTGGFNKALIEQVGLRQVGIAMRYDPSNEKVREAMEAKTIAVAQGEAKKATAEAEKEVLKSLAQGRQAYVAATVAGFGGDNVAATNVLMAEEQPGLTTRVDGGATTVVPVGGGKK